MQSKPGRKNIKQTHEHIMNSSGLLDTLLFCVHKDVVKIHCSKEQQAQATDVKILHPVLTGDWTHVGQLGLRNNRFKQGRKESRITSEG